MKQPFNSFGILLLIILMSMQFMCSIYADDKPLVREIVVNKSDSVFRYTFYYDENRNKVMSNKYYLKNYSIFPLSRTEWVYENNNCIIQREQKWENGGWKTNHLINTEYVGEQKKNELYIRVENGAEKTEKNIIYNYDDGKLKSIKNSRANKENKNVTQQISFSYNQNKQVIQQIITTGSEALQTDTSILVRYTYNSTGKPDSVILMNNINNINLNESLTLYFYDKVSGNLTGQIQKKWNEKASKWENNTKIEYQYDPENRLTEEVYAYFNTLFWTSNTKYENIYDANGVLTMKIMYMLIYSQWRKIYTIEYSGTENGKPSLMESKYNFWGGETGKYVENFIPYYFNDEIAIMNADRMEVKYSLETTVTTNIQDEPDRLKVYPNPSNGVFYISLDDNSIQNWEIVNLNGQIVKNNRNEYHTGVVDLTGLPDGIYMIKATTVDNKLLKQKIVINKTK